MNHCRRLILAVAFLTPGSLRAADDSQQFFELKIRPVLVKHCYKCHSSNAKESNGGLLLDSRDASRRGGASGPAVVPGKPKKSLLLEAISYENRDLQMPPDSPLPKPVVDDFRKWIRDGAHDPREERNSRHSVKFDLEARKAEHWAWHPIRPKKDGDSVDVLIDRQLKKKGLSRSPRANPRVLLRRLSFDLMGLPPSTTEIDNFLVAWKKDSESAIRNAVDRLLDDQRFGEHWSRQWLDVVRYCETKGHVTDQERPFMWKYRDYVIDAFNDDLPYDRFIIEHLAGDLLPSSEHRAGQHGETNVAPTATGILFAHEMHFMAVDPVKQRWDQINAQIDIVSKAFLGLTLECSRCHDHKFDAISQQDYYALAGFFYSTEQGKSRTAPRQQVDGQAAAEVKRLEDDYQSYIDKNRKARFAAQNPKAGGEYFPVSEELGIQAPNTTRTLFKKMDALSNADPSWSQWARSAKDVKGQDVPLLIRGERRNKGPVVQRSFLSAIAGAASPDSKTFGSGSGRLWLARQITAKSNPLTARVWINRLWHHLFGRGIVATPNNFGKLGSMPTHPELLDYLAIRLIESDWSTKSVIREIVTSETYLQSSARREELDSADPDNHLLGRQNRRRLRAEQLRDAMLFVSGSLDSKMHGPSVDCFVPPYATANKPSNVPKSGPLDGNNRRSIYLKVRRNFFDPFLLTFDFPDRGSSVGRRNVTIVPSQALAMMNGPLVHELASDWGSRVSQRMDGFDQRVNTMCVSALGRLPDEPEKVAIRKLIESIDKGIDSVSSQTWKDIAHVLFNHSDFMWID